MNRLPPQFHRLAISSLSAQSAEQISLAAAPLVAVLALGANATETGFLQTAQTLPFLLFSIPFGVWADRHSRRTVMTLAESLRALALLGTLLLLALHGLNWPLLAMSGFIGATGTVAYNVAAPAIVPALVRREDLPRANGMIELARSAAYAAGPAAGGLLVSEIGGAWAYGAATALSACAVLLLSGLPVNTPQTTRCAHFVAEMAEGARFVWQNRYLRALAGTTLFFNIGFFTLQAIYVPYAVHHLQLSAAQVGFTFGANGVGMMCGAYLASAIMRRFKLGLVLVIGPLCGLATSLMMLASIFQPSFWGAALVFSLLGAGSIIWVVSSTTLRQAITPAHILGRVSAINSTATFGARPLGALLGAAVAAKYGINACIYASVAGFAIQALVIVLSSAARLTHIPGEPHAGRAPALSR